MIRELKYQSIFQKGFDFHLANTLLDKDERTYRHRHNYYELFFLQQGKIKHLINKETVEVSPDEICFIRPLDEHCFIKSSNVPSALMTNIAFTPAMYAEVSSFLFKESFSEKIPISQHPAKIDRLLLEQLKTQTNALMQGHSEFSTERQTGIIKCLLVNVFMEISQRRESSKNDVPIWLKETCRKMVDKFNYTIGLDRMITLSGKSQEHLTRVMKKYISTTPTGFINTLRLQEAAQLLRSTQEPVLDIILETGFNNISHFNRVFKLKFHTTPRQYRKNNNTIINPE